MIVSSIEVVRVSVLQSPLDSAREKVVPRESTPKSQFRLKISFVQALDREGTEGERSLFVNRILSKYLEKINEDNKFIDKLWMSGLVT